MNSNMKKTVLLLTVLMLSFTSVQVNAQKKNVSRAKSKLLAEKPDFKAAKELIVPALSDPTTMSRARTWFVAGNVFFESYKSKEKIKWTNPKKADIPGMAKDAKASFIYYTTADSLDKLPNKKGEIKPKYSEDIVNNAMYFRRFFTEAGSYYYKKNDYVNALEMFQQYLAYDNYPYLKEKITNDTIRNLITYYCALSATQSNDTILADKYYEEIKDSIDPKWVYQHLTQDYMSLNDSVNMIRMFKAGASKFPSEQFYTRNLINYYLNRNKMDEAVKWIDEAVKTDTTSAVLMNLKGRIVENKGNIEEALACWEKAISMDSTFADAYGNIGRIYYNRAVEELDRVNAIRDNAKYRREKAKMKKVFEKPLPYFEHAHKLSPDERDYIIALRGIYYNLGSKYAKKYQLMDKKLKSL